jgi:endonuclease/exonuclease/phosphatase family metal-dependent hydrolase
VPVWALDDLGRWSGMRPYGAVARPPRGGALGRRVTGLAPDLVRSAFSGQANALLLGGAVVADAPERVVTLNPGARLERRVCHVVPVRRNGERLTIGNLHATAHDHAAARLELVRVADELSVGGAALVCGDFNVPATGLDGFSAPIAGIDQIVVRELEFERRPATWPRDRRRLGRVLLSDHAPVEAVIR